MLLIAETGLLAGRRATVHPAYAATFRENYPDAELMVHEVLIAREFLLGDLDLLI